MQCERDVSANMLTITSSNRQDLDSFVTKLMPTIEVQYSDDNEATELPEFYLRAPQANVAAAIALATAGICYPRFADAAGMIKGKQYATDLLQAQVHNSAILHAEAQIYDLEEFVAGTKDELILSIGAEGGSIELFRHDDGSRCAFSIKQEEHMGELIDDPELDYVRRTLFHSWTDAIGALPSSWPRFHALFVLPHFRCLIRGELRALGLEPAEHDSWCRALGLDNF